MPTYTRYKNCFQIPPYGAFTTCTSIVAGTEFPLVKGVDGSLTAISHG